MQQQQLHGEIERSILVANMVTVKALGRIAIVVIEAVLDLMV